MCPRSYGMDACAKECVGSATKYRYLVSLPTEQSSLVEKPSQIGPSDRTESVTAGSETTLGTHSSGRDLPEDHTILEEITVQTNVVQEYETFIEEETIYEELTISGDGEDAESYEEWTVMDENSYYYEEETVADDDDDDDDGKVETRKHDEGEQSLLKAQHFLPNASRGSRQSLHETDTDKKGKVNEHEESEGKLLDFESSPCPTDLQKNIFFEAASLGRLTRSKEHVVETVSAKKEIDQDNVPWLSPGLLALETQSLQRRVSEQAALKGARTKLPEIVVDNFDPEVGEEADFSREEGFAEGDDGSSRRSVKDLRLLFEAGNFTKSTTNHPSIDQLVKRERHRCQITILGPPKSLNSTTVPLPIPTLSHTRHHASEPSVSRLDLARQVAVAAWDRRFRTHRRRMVQITDACPCRYCANACPQQTYAYKQLSVVHNSSSSKNR